MILAAIATICIGIYWWARINNDLSVVSIVQPLITILCIGIALLALRLHKHSRALILCISCGLAVALLGDFLNLNMNDPYVVIRGLVIFVVAYMTYAIGLTIINGFHFKDIFVGVVALLFNAALMIYLWPHLGEMKIPGLIYSLILPFLVTRAISTFFSGKFSKTQSVLLTAGTGMVYLGDIEFALHAYAQVLPMLAGPILYAGGQLLISLSPSYAE